MDLIDSIQEGTGRPAVIVLFSDHGPGRAKEGGLPTTRLRNLFASWTPGRQDVFRDDQTLVNVLPALWDAYLDADIPSHADTLYAWDDLEDLLALREVREP